MPRSVSSWQSPTRTALYALETSQERRDLKPQVKDTLDCERTPTLGTWALGRRRGRKKASPNVLLPSHNAVATSHTHREMSLKTDTSETQTPSTRSVPGNTWLTEHRQMFWAGLRLGQGPEPSPSLLDFVWSPAPSSKSSAFYSRVGAFWVVWFLFVCFGFISYIFLLYLRCKGKGYKCLQTIEHHALLYFYHVAFWN